LALCEANENQDGLILDRNDKVEFIVKTENAFGMGQDAGNNK
jgi:hypothetical protein